MSCLTYSDIILIEALFFNGKAKEELYRTCRTCTRLENPFCRNWVVKSVIRRLKIEFTNQMHDVKTCFCLCENKDPGQLCSNHAADQQLF